MTPATQTVELTVADEHAWLRVDAYLAQQLHWRSRRSLAELLAAGQVIVNGHRVKKAHRLAAGDVVMLRLPRKPEADLDLAEIPLRIVYEDDDLVVVDKPGNLAVHPASTCQYRNLLRRLQHHYAVERPDPGVEPSVLHRLDRTTSGVVALAKRRTLIDFYTRQFAARTTNKHYVAVVHGCMEGEGSIELPIHTPADRPVVVGEGGRPSRTDWRVLVSTDHACRLAITLHTGRKHQIRAHLAAVGHPLYYDGVYGPPRRSTWPEQARPLLHAARLELDHRDGRRLCFSAPVPEDMERAWARLTTDS
ncbi:RluA family pseudouridine synthase [Paraliomyxa miuraensis]|uniref:RluA family pseudouridine synthase n=1 Tax=Paraliomyxa miuraensis TaxID=376150 RepID=UPI00224D9C6C|nr:RluA family pseudouridine synthase [Paraliomyxa miuraensis]MCX4241575.1 RluA family pseudouridine synthase [Paraliomyxa miuraensis]